MPRDPEGFDRQVKLPPQLKTAHVRKAIDYIERETAEFVDVYFEQANVLSVLVGIFGVRAFHSLSPYKKHKHPDVAQQRFPDLSLGGNLTRHLNTLWSRRVQAGHGHFSRITTMRGGISYGAI